MCWRRICAVGLALAMSCGSTQPTSTSDEKRAATDPRVDCVVYDSFVPADQVVVQGELSIDDRQLVDWALSRFLLVDMYLPGEIEVSFDPTRAACFGAPGRCVISPEKTPEVFVCEDGEVEGSQQPEKLTILHELAHLWHAAQGGGEIWPDASPIVGGVANDTEAAWHDRSEERVADTISWGLTDHLQRKARGIQSCDVMYLQFIELTGFEPLPPVPPECLPLPKAP